MSSSRCLIAVAMLLVVAGCRDGLTPLTEPVVTAPSFQFAGGTSSILRQSSSAPPLETYQLSFWAYTGKETKIAVNYVPQAGEKAGQPFLAFYVPKIGLIGGAGGAPLARAHDSVLVTLTIDSTTFQVDFQPAGVQFAEVAPAVLTLHYQNRDPDLNGDGVVNDADQALLHQLSIYYEQSSETKLKVPSKNDVKNQYVLGGLLHFSQYAVSW